MNEIAIGILEKEKESLIEYKDDCCVNAQKLIGTSDFTIWEKRREGMEEEIRSVQKAISQLSGECIASGKVTGIMVDCKNKECVRIVHTDKLGEVVIGKYEGDPIGKNINIIIQECEK